MSDKNIDIVSITREVPKSLNYVCPNIYSFNIISDIFVNGYMTNPCKTVRIDDSKPSIFVDFTYRGEDVEYEYIDRNDLSHICVLRSISIHFMQCDSYFLIDLKYRFDSQFSIIILKVPVNIVIDCSYFSLMESLQYILNNIKDFII